MAQGSEPIGEPGFITRCEGNLILEMDGRPTLKALEEVFQELPDDERERAMHNLFVGIAVEENASPSGVTSWCATLLEWTRNRKAQQWHN